MAGVSALYNQSGSYDDPLAVFDAMLVLGEDSTTENTTENIETPQLPLEPRLRTLQRLRELTAYPRRVQIAPLPIQTIGDYQLLNQLALTPMGATYVARRKDAPKLYTLKMLIPYPEWGIKGPQSGVLLSAKLDHPGLAKIVETGSYRDQTYVISEYVHGFSLRRLLDAASRDGSALPLAWIKEMWRQLQGAEVRLSSEISAFDGYAFILEQVALVADALHYAHCNGVVHCDVKPANILLSLCGRTALIDFGIAHAALDERPEKTPKISSDDHGSFFGSFGYAAPEQFLGQQKDLQAHTDTWGLGATLFEMITGQTPFGRLDFASRKQAALHRPPSRASELVYKLPKEIDSLLYRALDPDPSARFTSADEMASALRECVKEIERG